MFGATESCGDNHKLSFETEIKYRFVKWILGLTFRGQIDGFYFVRYTFKTKVSKIQFHLLSFISETFDRENAFTGCQPKSYNEWDMLVLEIQARFVQQQYTPFIAQYFETLCILGVWCFDISLHSFDKRF
jgi:hypothetical protein